LTLINVAISLDELNIFSSYIQINKLIDSLTPVVCHAVYHLIKINRGVN